MGNAQQNESASRLAPVDFLPNVIPWQSRLDSNAIFPRPRATPEAAIYIAIAPASEPREMHRQRDALLSTCLLQFMKEDHRWRTMSRG